jgi:hypothetical protein
MIRPIWSSDVHITACYMALYDSTNMIIRCSHHTMLHDTIWFDQYDHQMFTSHHVTWHYMIRPIWSSDVHITQCYMALYDSTNMIIRCSHHTMLHDIMIRPIWSSDVHITPCYLALYDSTKMIIRCSHHTMLHNTMIRPIWSSDVHITQCYMTLWFDQYDHQMFTSHHVTWYYMIRPIWSSDVHICCWWRLLCLLRFEVFKAVTAKSAVFCDVTPCGSCKNSRIRGTYRLHHRGWQE